MALKYWLSGSAAAVTLTVAGFAYQGQTQAVTGLLSCDCEAGVEYNNALPSSHPTNQCALASETPSTSWYGWATGSSRSTSFHFLDLLELISRNSSDRIQSDKKPTE
ncbi:hypothetical protein GCM10011369_01460 [Neiella marina]|uniref:Uncharacterized protein n=1 Tax=Neiella marina TaxID=508461 RepID=A0A8J2U1Q0_9GAMM|nr:hypothetical protein [Neiella marina]GGA63787.1 hypothetical protein GCM10011369_01460 [Neiella marina]